MKKTKILTIAIICIIFITTCITTIANNSEIYYQERNITISFSTDSELSYDKKQSIANKLVYGNSEDNQASTYSWCWLTGHDIINNTVTTIEHKVDTYEPRCIKRIYSVETCSSCDYINETLKSTTYVYCCPED